MAATIRGSTAATATNSPTSPASTQVGDLVLVIHWTRGAAGVPTHTLQSGNGFVEVRSHSHDDGSTDGRLSLAYKVATSAGANAYNAYTSNTGTDFAGIVVLTAGTYDPDTIGDAQNSVTQTNNAVPNPASIVTPVADCLVLAIAAWHLGSAATVAVTPPTNYGEVWEMAGSNTAELSVASRVIATATTEDPGTFGDDVAPNGTCSITVAFRPMAVIAGTLAETDSKQTSATGGGTAITGGVAETASEQTEALAGELVSTEATGALAETQGEHTSTSSGGAIVAGGIVESQAQQTQSGAGGVRVGGVVVELDAEHTGSSSGKALVGGTTTETQAEQLDALGDSEHVHARQACCDLRLGVGIR